MKNFFLPKIGYNHWTFPCYAFGTQLVLIFCLWITYPSQAQVELLKDLNQNQDPWDREYREAVDLNGVLLFTSNGELWKTNGTARGTYKLKSFQGINSLTKMGGTVFFSATDESGTELWKTTGMTYTTVKVKDIIPGPDGSGPGNLTVAGNTLFFTARNSATGLELWRSNGTSAGTSLVKDIMSKGGSSNPSFLTDVNGVLFFAANDGINGYELWKSDGTTTGTTMVKDIRPGVRLSSAPGDLENVNGTVFFTAIDGVVGRELWKSNGTVEGTVLVKDILAGERNTDYKNLTNVNGTLFFSADDLIHGEELWKSDGTEAGTMMVVDFTPGKKGSGQTSIWSQGMANFTAVKNKLYFTAHKSGPYYFCTSDGTAGGTTAIWPARSGLGDLFAQFSVLNDAVYFLNGGREPESGLTTINLMRESPTGEISHVKELLLNDYYNWTCPFLVRSNGLLYFYGRKDLPEGYSLYRSDGTVSGTNQLVDTYVVYLNPGGNPKDFLKIGNDLYFTTSAQTEDYMDYNLLWKTDGTTEGTVQLDRMQQITGLINVGGQLHFAGYNEGTSVPYWDLYKTDGTAAGTVKLGIDLGTTDYSRPPTNLTVAGANIFYVLDETNLLVTDRVTARFITDAPRLNTLHAIGKYVYFQGEDAFNDAELWRTDGTAAGTKMVKNINLTGSSSPEQLTSRNGILYFVANDGVHGYELWRSTGTSYGTSMVKDVRSADVAGSSDILNITAVNDFVYFQSLTEYGAIKLWLSNGTRAGTIALSETPGAAVMIRGDSNRIFFAGYESGTGSYNLWGSNGSAESTKRIQDLNTNELTNLSANNTITLNGVLYFNLDGTLWRSDSSSCGTYPLNFVQGNPMPLQSLGDYLIFGADDPVIGRELFKLNVNAIPGNDCGEAAYASGNMEATEPSRISSYPNPFDNTFQLMISGASGERYAVQILDLNNVTREQREILYNEKCTLGSSLTPGMYILRIRESNNMTTLKILKK